jgi:DNA helicase HerA-like ATPase
MESIFSVYGDLFKELFVNRKGKFIKGFLIDLDGNECEIWFPYSLEAMRLIRTSALLAVPNFASIVISENEEEKLLKNELHFSVLQVKGKKVVHYTIEALKQNPERIELEKELSKLIKDWERSVSDDESPNLKIIVKADLTDREIFIPKLSKEVKIQFNSAEPVQGHEVYLLKDEIVERIINKGVVGKKTAVAVGKHKFYDNVRVFLDYEQLIRRHYGIFATTGAGKSNLTSNLMYQILANDELATNVVIFDVNNEYTTLLIDLLVQLKDSHIIILDHAYCGNNLSAYLQGHVDKRSAAAREFADTIVIPSALKKYRDQLATALEFLLADGRVKVFSQGFSMETFFNLVYALLEEIKFVGKGAKQKKKRLLAVVKEVENTFRETLNLSNNLTEPLFGKFLSLLDEAAEKVLKEEKEKFEDKLEELRERITEEVRKVLDTPQFTFSISLDGVVRLLSDDDKSLVILLASDDNHLRNFAHKLIMTMYQLRKSNGIIDPPVLFFFDEADLFIPRDASSKDDAEKEAIKRSKEACITLARRGRKYGLGLGVSTQRIAQNDTTIIAQLNTYFVSKLARKYDRQVIAETYGIAEEMLATAGTFVPGDWFILSSAATGIKNVPIPTHLPNAEDRIEKFLTETMQKVVEETKRRLEQFLKELAATSKTFAPLSEEEFRDVKPLVYPE